MKEHEGGEVEGKGGGRAGEAGIGGGQGRGKGGCRSGEGGVVGVAEGRENRKSRTRTTGEVKREFGKVEKEVLKKKDRYATRK